MKNKRVLVVSDTHGYVDDVIEYIKKNNIDYMIHAGDYSLDAYKIRDICNIKTFCVKGNNDFSDNISKFQKIIEIGNEKILLVHGHKEGVYFSKDNLINKSLENDCNIVIFGHTHVYYNKYDNNFGIRLLNPGSPTLPRDGHKSLILLEINNESYEVKKICIDED